MPTNILSIYPRRIDFRTQTNADWLDGLLVWQASKGGVVAGPSNVGTGSLSLDSVAPGMDLGTHLVTVTAVENFTQITVTDPSGAVTGEGVVGAETYADGLRLTLSAGSTPFALGDSFAISILPAPLDVTGIVFDLQLRATQTTANVALSATSNPVTSSETPTIVVGGAGGQVALRVLKASLAREKLPPATYVYDLLASADGLTLPAFYGTVDHVDGVTFIL